MILQKSAGKLLWVKYRHIDDFGVCKMLSGLV